MITSKTQAAIAVLNDIYAGGDIIRADACQLTEQDMDILLSKLLSAGLIKLSDKGDSRDIQVYSPARDSSDVSLLDILEATGEHLDCNHPTTEEISHAIWESCAETRYSELYHEGISERDKAV